VAETKEKLESPKKPRSGLSINDTIAANANLSVGAKGVDTSGVEAGAGAGAGSTYVTPGAAGSSPAPNIVPRSRLAAEEASVASREEIAARAYQRWCQRGCPEGSPNVDWHAAEEELRPTR
jgi:hypothetical protein